MSPLELDDELLLELEDELLADELLELDELAELDGVGSVSLPPQAIKNRLLANTSTSVLITASPRSFYYFGFQRSKPKEPVYIFGPVEL